MRLSRGMGSRLSHTCLVTPAPSSAFSAGCHQPQNPVLNVAEARFAVVVSGLFLCFWVKEGQFPFPHLSSLHRLHVQINDTINVGMCFGSYYQER